MLVLHCRNQRRSLFHAENILETYHDLVNDFLEFRPAGAHLCSLGLVSVKLHWFPLEERD